MLQVNKILKNHWASKRRGSCAIDFSSLDGILRLGLLLPSIGSDIDLSVNDGLDEGMRAY